MVTKKTKIRMIFLGAGSAFTVGANNFHSNVLIESSNGKRIIIDCGTDARHSLYEQNLTYKDITDVYISHLHADHVGGLEWLGFTHRFDESCDRPNIYVSELMAEDLWNKTLSGTMRSLEGEPADITSYFKIKKIPPNGSFKWEKIDFQLVQTVHIMNGKSLAPCHGLFFKLGDKKVYYTADSQFSPHMLEKFYEEADIIFHDCETSNCHSNVHAHFDELCTLPNDIKKKMWLYHYNPGPLPDAQAAGFQGFVKKGQVFEF